MEDGAAMQTDDALDEHHDMHYDNARPLISPSGKPVGHKRSLSGSILSRLSFLRTSLEEPRSPPETTETRKDVEEAISPTYESAMASAHKLSKTRQRKGSLRKTALLGTGKLKAEGRERRNSLLQRRPSVKQSSPVKVAPAIEPQYSNPVMEAFQRRYSYDLPSEAASADSSRSISAQSLTLNTTDHALPNATGAPTLASPIKSPTSQKSYTSTTDEDEALSFSRPVHQQPIKSPPSSSDSSYFPSPPSPARLRSITKPLSPLAALPMDTYVSDEDWDYSETAWWGWVVLIVTWIVFVIGMGSCLEVWSWAWDVGQTPYAPPELEDDPTLPIVGYYPALIVLSGVMAWVWVVTNWLGMKYFKHATIQGDDL